MRLSPVTTPSMLLAKPVEQELTNKPGQLIPTEILVSADNQVMLTFNQQLVEAKSPLPLAAVPATLHVVEADPSHPVVRIIGQGSDTQPIDDLVHSLGLTLNGDRRALARELVLSGLPVDRDLLLQLEKVMQTDVGKSLDPTALVRLAKAKLPLKETAALAVSHWEQSDQGQQCYYYIDLDFTASPLQWSWHLVEPEGEHRDGMGASATRPIVIGCQTENLGPVLVVVQDAKASISVRIVMADNDTKSFVGHELAELRDRLEPLVRSIQLAVDTLSDTRPQERAASILKHLNIQI